MKKENILKIFLVFFIGSFLIGTTLEFLPENAFAEDSQNGTLLIKDEITNETTNVSYEAQGKCYNVIDGDTILVAGIGKVRLVGIDAPEKYQIGYSEAKNFVEKECLGKTVYLDIDDKRNQDKYGRTLAIVYTEDKNINKALLQKNLAKIMYIPPSEFVKGFET